MKTVKNLTILMLLAVVGINTAIAGNSDKTENRNVKNFNGIKVSTGIDLYITMGNSEEVRIVAEDNIIDDVVTEVKDGTLHIYLKKNNWFNWGRFNETRKAYVTVKQLESIDASSGSDVRSENTLKGDEIDIQASSGSDVYLDIVYKNVSLKTSSGSDAKLTGKAKYFTASASSGSDIVARDFETEKCNVKANSGSDATVNVSDELVAKASSGADIRYYGNPKTKDTDESSGGDVSGR
ncbi:MAG TPA: head GIN domain-containing protein [Draconibacterium sp.]|nr:head GIN domain-containing protein [Draconibacterium sp.]